MKMDLHLHTNHSSDGEFSVAQLIKKVKAAKLRVFAIADHNSTEGVKEYLTHFKDEQLMIITAIEIDCVFNDTHLHVLGYGIDPYFEGFDQLRARYFKQDLDNSALLLKKVRDLGIVVDEKQVQAISFHGVINAEMIAEVALADARNANHALLKPFRKGGTRSDNPYVNFYWDVCAPGKPAHVPGVYFTLKAAVDLIHAAGGIAILAHPGNNVHEDESLLKSIIDHNVIGLETYSSYHSQAQVDFYHKFAKSQDLIQTIGSDFHGKTKPAIKIGQCQSYEGDAVLFSDLIRAINRS